MLTRLAASNPGVFHADASSLSEPFLVSLVIAIGLIIISAIIATTAPGKRSMSILVIVGVIGVTGTFAAGIIGEKMQSSAQAVKQDHYNERVQSWLKDDYNISATPGIAGRMAKGESFAVVFGESLISVTVIEDTTGGLAVIDEHRKVLKPVTH